MRTEPAWPNTDEMRARLAELRATEPPAPPTGPPPPAPPEPVATGDRSKNVLRPERLSEIVGQDEAVALVKRFIETCQRKDLTLDNVLLVGAGGTGKSTFSHVIACEMGVNVYEAQAPVNADTLLALRQVMEDRDILRVEEIHLQALSERRGKTAGSQPEGLYALMEDGVLPTAAGLLDFPDITIIGTTTDEGLLPDSFIDRFPIEPHLVPYDETALAGMARWNGDKLGVVVTPTAADMFARASRGVPRQVNNFVKNAASLNDDVVGTEEAREVIVSLNHCTLDGLTIDMQRMLTFLYTMGRHENAKGDVVYRASVNTIATAIGKSRDSKAISLRVEPYLIAQGYIQIGQGRVLTEAGIERAKELL